MENESQGSSARSIMVGAAVLVAACGGQTDELVDAPDEMVLELEPGDASGAPSGPGSLGEQPRNQEIVPGFDVLIELAGPDIQLSWPDQGPDRTYEVWRSPDAYFDPGDEGSVLLTADASGLAHVDLGAGVDDPAEHYYRVRSFDAGQPAEDSTIVGKNVVPLEKGYTNLGLCLIDELDTAGELFDRIGPSSISAHKWDEATQSWSWSWATDPGPGITFSPGEVVAINVGDEHPEQHTSVGYVPAPDDIEVQLLPGLNMVTVLPYALGDMMASELMALVPSATAIQWWDPAAQSTLVYTGPGDDDFELSRCGHVKVEVTEPSAWPPVWCPQQSELGAVSSAGGSVDASGTIVEITNFDVGAPVDVRVAVHGEQLVASTPSYPDETCAGGVIEVLPTTGDPAGLPAPSGTITVPCSEDNPAPRLDHTRPDGSHAYARASCDASTGLATFDFTGFGHFVLDDTVVPGCETCPAGQGVSVCEVDSWWPPRGECYTAPNDFEESVIGPAGGSVTHPDGATLTIPAGAVTEPLTFNLDVAWEQLPGQRLPDGAIAPWRVLTAEREGWMAELAVPATLTFECGPTDGRLLVEHRYDFRQQTAVECVNGEATLELTRVGYVIPQGLVQGTAVDADGGTVMADDGAQITVPPGALSETVELSIVPILDDRGPAIATRQLASTYAFLPHGQTFDEPVEIRLPAPDCVPGRTTVLVRADEQATEWTELPAECVDGFAVVERSTFSVGTAVDPVALSGADCSCLCGEDVREDLSAVAQQAIAQWQGATDEQQESACGGLEFALPNPLPIGGTGRITKNGWDIGTLAFAESRTFGEHPDTQRATVSVDGQCYFAGEVNYFIWGVTEHLCDHAGHGLPPGLSAAAIWKHRVDNGDALEAAPGRVSWSNAGYDAVGEAGGIPGLIPSGLELNSGWVAPTNNVTTASQFADQLDGADIDCEPTPSEQPYQGAEGPFVWSWGGSGHSFSGSVGAIGTPVDWVCAEDDAFAATLGEAGILVAIAPNDVGVVTDLGLTTTSYGAFDAVASYDAGGTPMVELSSSIPTAFEAVETVEYEYQPTSGGIPENLQALIEIEPTCPIAESDRPSASYCGCAGERSWDDASGSCECPADTTWDPATQTCEDDDPDGSVCELTDASYCTNGPSPQINLGNISPESCRDQCEVLLDGNDGCWIKAYNQNCYCRTGTINYTAYAPNLVQGGACTGN